MTVLITGGAGFIGSRLSARLGTEDVVVFDNMHEQVHGPDAPLPADRDGLRFVRGDVTDPSSWDALLTDLEPTTVVHLAAETGTGQSLHQASRHANVNVTGTAVMLDAFVRNDRVPDSVVLTSSRAVYGEGAWMTDSGDRFYGRPRSAQRLDRSEWLPIGEKGQTGVALAHAAGTVEPRPSNVYAATKLAQENILTAWCTSMNASLSVLRLQNVYGAGQALRNPYTGVLTAFARQIITGDTVKVFEGGGIVRDFVHVSDVVSALIAAIETPSTTESRTVDIGSGAPGELIEFAGILATIGGESPVIPTNDYRLGDVRTAFADNATAAEVLGYEPTVSFREGAEELLEWARKEIARGE